MKHIKQLVLSIVLFLNLAASPAESAIIYSGKLNLIGPNFSIDINNDESKDFITEWTWWGGGNGFSVSGFDTELNFNMRFINTELVGFSGFPGTKAPLSCEEIIGPTAPQGLLWAFNSNDSMMWVTDDMWNEPHITYSGVWHDVKQKYLGLEMSVGSNAFYGWIQLDTDAFNNITLVDYAYENVSGTPIIAGVVPIPEPMTLYLLFSGILMMILFRTIRWSGRGEPRRP